MMLLIVLLILCSSEVLTASLETRIIGGWEAALQQFNYMAAIQVETATSRFFCGGGMLNQLWVITAANCVYNAKVVTIQLGSPSLYDEDSSRRNITTSEYYIHPDFNPDTIENDIAVIRLLPAVSFTTRILPIHLPANDFLEDDTNVVVLGWGHTSDDDSTVSNKLRYINGTVMSNIQCRGIYGNALTDNMACIQADGNQGTCIGMYRETAYIKALIYEKAIIVIPTLQNNLETKLVDLQKCFQGDNGGPLVVYANSRNNVMGVASFISGNGCESNDPSGFTRTWPYITWLRNVTNIA